MKRAYPEIEPFRTHRLKVSPVHELYLEECGNPAGQPILFLHGGPGAGTIPKHRQFFDPKHYRIILFDQRGAGRSTPHANLEDNTTWHLVEDIEKIRTHLGIQKWIVFGGSWGSTLSLAYAQTHPQNCLGLILRGIFLCRPEEIKWFYQEGAEWIYPDEWRKYVAPVPENDRHEMVRSYYRLLTSENESVRLRAAKAWSGWEGATLKLVPDPTTISAFTSDHMAVSIARIECHYFINNAFLEPNQLLKNVDRIRHLPCVIVHGRYGVVCPVKSAFDLHSVWPEAKLEIIQDAGHAADEPGILDALIRATDEFKNLK